ncbi:MAG: prohibitin family protein [Maricaulaceae bacterium]|jgi:regulator of protease activity HflC (stomatin/prohibitin superfamily)
MGKFIGIPAVLVVLAALALVGWRMAAYTIEQGERGVLLRFGEAVEVAGPGLHFKIPLVHTVRKVNIRRQYIDWSGEGVMVAYSRDQQPAEMAVRLTYYIRPDTESILELYADYGTVANYTQAVIYPRAAEQIKTTFGQFNAVTAVQSRQELNIQSLAAVVEAITGPGEIEGLDIHNIDFSDAYEASIEARMQAEVEVQRVNQNLERERTNAQIRVVQAQAEADAVRLAGEAEAAAIRARGDALRDNPSLISLNAVERWDGVLPTTMPPNSTVPFLSLPAGGSSGNAAGSE